MSDKVEGVIVLLIAYVIVLIIFIYPQLFNKYMLTMHSAHRKWWIAPKNPKSYTARPLLIRIYMSPFIIVITWVLYHVITGQDLLDH